MSLHAVKVKGRFYILKDITKNGKHSTTTVEKLGTAEEIMAAHSCDDAMEWVRQRALELDMKDREASDPEGRHYILARDNVRIPKGTLNSFNVGYLPLQKIYYDLRFPSICNAISKRHSFDFDLDTIFSRLIYSQILFPGSKLRVTDLSRRLFEHPDFEYHQVLRALSVISEHFDEIQSSLYKNSLKVTDRKAGVVFYDCTNYYFEIEKEEMYGEPFRVPQPDELIFVGWYEGGNIFRSGMTYYRGIGKLFYFQPGHELCRSFHNPYVQKVLTNAVRWAAPTDMVIKRPTTCPHRKNPLVELAEGGEPPRA